METESITLYTTYISEIYIHSVVVDLVYTSLFTIVILVRLKVGGSVVSRTHCIMTQCDNDYDYVMWR